MKNVLAVTIGLLSSSVVFADCDSNKLDAEHLTECIIEGAGENYDHWKAEYAKIGSGQSREEIKQTKASPPEQSPSATSN